MATFWVDVYSPGGGPDVFGTRLGAGPILSAVEWESTAKLDAAGSFSFTMPASDPKAALLRPQRVVWCYTFVDEVMVECGAGIVERITTQVGTPTLLRVRGPDLLAELAQRTVGQLRVMEMAWEGLDGEGRGSVRRVPLNQNDPEFFSTLLTSAKIHNKCAMKSGYSRSSPIPPL